MNFYQTLNDVLKSPRFEPVKRNKDGWQFIGHRFPIKGGISFIEVLMAQGYSTVLMDMVKK